MKELFNIHGKKDLSERISSSPFLFAIIDFILLNAAFFICNYLKRGTFNLRLGYGKLLFLFYLCWFFGSYIGGKFKASSYSNFLNAFITVTRSSLYIAYCIVFLIVVLGLEDYSILQVFSTCLFICGLEITALSFYFLFVKEYKIKETSEDETIKQKRKEYGSYVLVGADILMVFIAFFIVNLIKRGHFNLLPHYDKLLLLIYGVWFLCSMATKKFYMKGYKNFSFYFWQWGKAGILMVATLSIVVYGFRLFYFSRVQVFGSIIVLITLELIALLLYWWNQVEKKEHYDIESIETVKTILKQENIPLNIDIETIRKNLLRPARIKLQNKLMKDYSELFEFIDQNIDLNEMLCLETILGNSSDPFTLKIGETPTRLFLNLCKINDIRRMNQHFLYIHQMLLPGGYYISWTHTIKTHRQWIYSNFPRQIANVVYLIDFCYKRIMPKLPVLRSLYFALTKGKNRIISRAEVLGRLSFCGFEIVAEKDIKKRSCFIARKIKTPSLDQNPTYGPLIMLKRVGGNNKVIYIYKFRTMHPYSEYIQQYVFEMQGIQNGGKLNNDFRMTAWGKVMRKFWLDEIPMIYNWIKGDLKLVGVRPLSLHYLSLYDEKLQEMRKIVKPGLIPPFYADLPETFDEICESERRYINSFMQHPVKTQCVYFWKAFINIVLKGVRSH